MPTRPDAWDLPVDRALFPSHSAGWLWSRVALPPPGVRCHVEHQGLACITDPSNDQIVFGMAESLIELVPGVASVVRGWVGQIHLLRAEPEYDTSHSEPIWRTRIFVSVPERSDQVGGLRLAESVIHEALHLQLTGYEAIEPIVADRKSTMASPWRSEERPIQGVFHGLYVFSCLSTFFIRIGGFLEESSRSHVCARLRDIREEIGAINLDELASCLTPNGKHLASRWSREALSPPLTSWLGPTSPIGIPRAYPPRQPRELAPQGEHGG